MDKYSSIENLYRLPDFLNQEVIITEKIHGTNVRFGKINGGVIVGSRNNIIFDGVYNKQFDGYGFYNWAVENLPLDELPEGFIFYGEFFGTGIQKGVKYFPEDKRHFAGFDVKTSAGYLDWDAAVALYRKLGIDTVPELARGVFDIESLRAFVDCPSTWAKSQGVDSLSEGVVIRPLKEARDSRGNRVITKFKSERFLEKAKKAKNPKEPKEVSETFLAGAAYCTPARVENTIDKLRQEIDRDPDFSDIPLFLRLFETDVIKDAEDFPDDKKDQKEFLKGAKSNAVPLYKEWLTTI